MDQVSRMLIFYLFLYCFLHTDWDDESDAKPNMLILYCFFTVFALPASDMKPNMLILYWFLYCCCTRRSSGGIPPAAGGRAPRPPLGALIALYSLSLTTTRTLSCETTVKEKWKLLEGHHFVFLLLVGGGAFVFFFVSLIFIFFVKFRPNGRGAFSRH